MLRNVSIALLALLMARPLAAQDSAFIPSIDTLALYDSFARELAEFMDFTSRKADYADITAGVGNGNFNQRTQVNNDPKASSLTRMYYTLTGTYIHKWGLGMAGNASFTNSYGKFTLFQGYISPMFDIQRSKWGAGLSYYRYFNKDSLDFYTSPLVNEVYAYAAYRKGWLQPKLAFDYGWGSYSELVDLGLDSATIRRLRQRYPNMPVPKRYATTETKVNDFSIIASVRHPFRKKEVFGSRDWFVFTPTLMLVAGTSNFGTNLPLNTAGSYTIRQATMNNYLQAMYQTDYSSGFQLQSFNTLLAADYYLGKFYVGVTCMLMYTIPAELSRWDLIGNLNVGIRL